MPKVLLFSLFFLLLHPVSDACANSYRMDRARWAHASDTEKDKLIVKVMEFVVELESKYQREVRTSGFDWERYRRYTQIMERLESLLISKVHAQSAPDFRYYYRDFVEDMENFSSDGKSCIYAGWISKMGPGDRYCLHPKRVHRDRGANYRAPTGCRDPDQISCNPAIFGFREVNQRTLFCVPAGDKNSKNSSLECMQQALLERPSGDASYSTREARLANIREGIEALPPDEKTDYVQNLHRYVTRLCACDLSNEGMNQSYMDRIRPHRTCLGLLNMLRHTNNECQGLEVWDSSLAPAFTALGDYLTGEGAMDIMGRSNRESLDRYYRGFLDSIQSSNLGQVCTDVPPVTDAPGLSCTATCVANAENPEQRDCTFEIKNGNQDITASTLGEGVTNPVTLGRSEEKSFTVNGESIDCVLSEPQDSPPTDTSEFACSLTPEVVDGGVKFTLLTENLGDQTISEYLWVGGTADPSNAFATYPLPTDGTPVSASVKIKIDAAEHNCTGTYQPETPATPADNGNRQIEVTVQNSQTTSVRVTAKIDNSDADLGEGETIIWIARRQTTTRTTTTAPPPGSGGDGNGTPPTTSQPSGSSSSDTTISEGRFREVIVEKDLTTYKICAQLKSGGNQVAENCKDIPPRTVTPPVQGGPGGPQPFQPMPTPRLGTRADGIR